MICNVCDKCIHDAVCDRKAVLERIPYMTHCTYKHTEADVINPELEKIKAEIIKEKCDKCEADYNIQKCYDDNTIGWCDVFDNLTIIDNRIKELKGEN